MNQHPPTEPVLDMHDIQGIAMPGILKPHQRLIAFRVPPTRTADYVKFLREISSDVCSGRQVLDDRREFRAKRMATGQRRPLIDEPAVFVSIGLSYFSLLKLRPSAAKFMSPAFRSGLAARSTLLGDPTDPTAEGYAANWLVGRPGSEPDGLVMVAGDIAEEVRKKADSIARRMEAAMGAVIDYEEDADIRPDLPGHEMFGFDDGISQPGPRGLASEKPGDFVTDRRIDESETPEAWLFGRPGQDLVWPGEFVFGYPSTSPDPLIAGEISMEGPVWSKNGSFLVFRRLRQDVGLFWSTMQSQAQALKKIKGFEEISDEALAARVVGRWPSGAPVVRVPDGDNPDLGKDPLANNSFKYAADTVALKVKGYEDKFPEAKADPVGITCPWSAHNRKVNVRDSGSDMGGRDSTYNRRILRLGIPFGTPLPEADKYTPDQVPVPMEKQRGLLFLSIQTSLEDQFEFLQARWMNDPNRPKAPGGHDLLIGQNAAPDQNRVRSANLFGKDLASATVQAPFDYVVPTGGGYFFIPSISTLRDVLGDPAAE